MHKAGDGSVVGDDQVPVCHGKKDASSVSVACTQLFFVGFVQQGMKMIQSNPSCHLRCLQKRHQKQTALAPKVPKAKMQVQCKPSHVARLSQRHSVAKVGDVVDVAEWLWV